MPENLCCTEPNVVNDSQSLTTVTIITERGLKG